MKNNKKILNESTKMSPETEGHFKILHLISIYYCHLGDMGKYL